MKTVKEIAKQTGVSVRTLHHYDAIGLLKPTTVTAAGYRLYDEAALERLYLILLFREIGFPLKEIRGILDAPDYDRNRVLEQQIALLEKKKDRLNHMIQMTRGIKLIGVNYLKWTDLIFRRSTTIPLRQRPCMGKPMPTENIHRRQKAAQRSRNMCWGIR